MLLPGIMGGLLLGQDAGGGGPSPTYPSFVNLAAASSASSATSMPMNLPASIVSGNVLLAVTTVVSTRNPVWPAGWTAIGAGFAAYRIADGSESVGPTVTWTGISTQAGWIAQYTGAGNGVGATRDNQAQSGTPATVSAITTTADASLCVAAIISGSTTVPTTPSGFTSDSGVAAGLSSIRFASAQVANSGGSSGNMASTVDSGNVWRAVLVELKS